MEKDNRTQASHVDGQTMFIAGFFTLPALRTKALVTNITQDIAMVSYEVAL